MSEAANSTSVNAVKNEQTLKLRPTLYIGIGGTGMEVMMRVRRRILNASWGKDNVRLDSLANFPLAQFIHYDLDHNAVIDSGRAQNEDLQYDLVKFSDDEKLIENFALEKYIRDDLSLSRYPHVQTWFPLTPQKVRELGIDPGQGAGQIRAISRLYFFDKYTTIRDKIRSKINILKAGVSRDETLKKLNLQHDPSKYRIVVIGSVAGGTGSGAFLDMGWLSKWIADQEVEAADVELMMFLPSGYAKANKQRTEGNAYAALMELETAMIGHSDYVKRWDGFDKPELQSKPYDEVFLIDTGNLAQQVTSDIQDVYSMVADTLFEDFRSADFANRKRSVAVNQRQHKMHMYTPPIPTHRFGDMKLNYALAYSAFGQATLDTLGRARYDEYTFGLASDMLKAFFGVASANPIVNRASNKQRDNFMASHMYLNRVAFNNLPDFSPASLKKPEIRELNSEFIDFNIVDVLLRSSHNGAVAIDFSEETRQRVSQRIDQIRGIDRDQWAAEVRKAKLDLGRSVVRDTDATSDTTEDRITHHRKALFEILKSDIEKRLYSYLDNQELGGFEYVISLVEQIKDQISNTTSGVCAQLTSSAQRYTDLKIALESEEYEKQLKDLEDTRGKGLFGWATGNKEEQARAILDHISKDIGDILSFHLRAKAANEAIVLMQQLSAWLGEKKGVDDQGQTIWNGLIGSLIEGQQAVLAMMQRLEHDKEVIHQQVRTKHATLQIIETEELKRQQISPQVLQGWAQEAFTDIGGSKELFRALLDIEQQKPLLLKIIMMAENHLEATFVQSAEEDLLFDALEKMTHGDRKKIFEEWLQRAMPWIEARSGGDFMPSPDCFKCFIGVNDADRFKKHFQNELMTCIPKGWGLNAEALSIVETGDPGRAVCYIELSGIPLTILRGIENWRISARKEESNIPLHTHIDSTRFKHPIAPTPNELSDLANQFKYYLKAVMLGVLVRSNIPDLIPNGQYEFTVARGDSRRLSNERGMRLNGLPLNYKDDIQAQVDQKFRSLNQANLAMLIALADYYAREVYTPRLKQNEMGVQTDHVGFACAITKELVKELREHAMRMEVSEEWIQRALNMTDFPEEMRKWATPVDNSDEDAYSDEVREAIRGRRLKWVMNMSPSVLQQHEQWLQPVLVNSAAPAAMPPPVPGAVPPPIMPQYQYYIAINGQSHGPYSHAQMIEMQRNQQITATTMVWREGLPAWLPLLQCSELALTHMPVSGMPPII